MNLHPCFLPCAQLAFFCLVGFLPKLAPAALSLPAPEAVPLHSSAAPAPPNWARTAANPCHELVRHLPNVSKALCQAAQLQPSNAQSVKGRRLLVRDVAEPDARLRVLVVGGIHGDELSSASLALHWIELASQNPGALPQAVHWRFIPALNPDGLMAQPPRRMNANGVDLNRNFPTPRWEREAIAHWEKRTRRDPRRWPGPKALSEPESRFLHGQMAHFKPHLIVSIHAPYALLDFDGPSQPPTRLGRLVLHQLGTYPGSLGNYGGVHGGLPVVTLELPNALRTPLDAEMRRMWLDLLSWMDKRMVAGLGDPGRAGRGATP